MNNRQLQAVQLYAQLSNDHLSARATGFFDEADRCRAQVMLCLARATAAWRSGDDTLAEVAVKAAYAFGAGDVATLLALPGLMQEERV